MPRPAGIPKAGGRKEGTPNKATATREAEIRAAGMTPLEFMLGVMRDDGKTVERRLRRRHPMFTRGCLQWLSATRTASRFKSALRIGRVRSRSGTSGRAG